MPQLSWMRNGAVKADSITQRYITSASMAGFIILLTRLTKTAACLQPRPHIYILASTCSDGFRQREIYTYTTASFSPVTVFHSVSFMLLDKCAYVHLRAHIYS